MRHKKEKEARRGSFVKRGNLHKEGYILSNSPNLN